MNTSTPCAGANVVYDVVIVGAGVASAILAHELGGKGKRVLILEAGRATRNDEEGWSGALNTYYNATAKVPNSPFPATSYAPQPDVLQFHRMQPGVPDSSGYFVQQGPQPFASDYNRSKGGTTLHWLGTALRMLPADFKLRDTYGVGTNWPINYEDLRPYYERAEAEIGVSGDSAVQQLPGVDPKEFWGNYQYPMRPIPDSYVAKRFAERLKGLKVNHAGRHYPIYVTSTPQGRNSMPNPDYIHPVTGKKGYQPVGTPGDPLRGERCMGNSSCVPICPVQAKYSALRTLRKAQYPTSLSARAVEIQNQSVASKIRIDNNGRVTGIDYIAYDQSGAVSKTTTAIAKVYVVAAHTVETAKLMLISGLAQESDQLGRNLMDHPTLLTWGWMKEPVWPFRGPGSTNNIPTFRDGPFRSEHSAFIVPIDNWGWVWSAFAPGAQLADLVYGRPGLFGKNLRQRVAADFSRQITLQWEFEQLGEPANRVTIDPRFLDPLGLPRPVINYKISPYVLKAMEAAFDMSKQVFSRVKIKDCTRYPKSAAGHVKYNRRGYEYRGAGHLVGTHRMGFHSGDSVTDSWMRCWEHRNLYLVGCGSMPSIGTSNPTLTMSALAFRAAESIIKDLNRHAGVPS